MDSESLNFVVWHTLSQAEALSELESAEDGLAEEEVEKRRQFFGSNELPRKPRPGPFTIFLRQFKSPLIYILGIAALVSLIIGENVDAGFIAAVLLINAIVGGYQEWRAEKSNEALEKMLKINATVIRKDVPMEIDAEGLVPGDVVWLESGQRVPADLRLLMGHNLEIDESPLTGESLPVFKDPNWIGQATDVTADQKNRAHAGTTIVKGRGRGLVVATGVHTFIGRLALDVISAKAGKAPLIMRLEKFTKVVGIAVILSAFAVSIVGVTRQYGLMEMFLFAVALAVSAIPEGLPVAVTVALSIGTNRMARRGVIVRQLAAVEGLGSCTLIASDKTGTLTCNELTVREIRIPSGQKILVEGEGFSPEGKMTEDGAELQAHQNASLDRLLRVGLLCNESYLYLHEGIWAWRGDPTEVCLLTLAIKGGWSQARAQEQFPEINSIPFEAERQYAATFNRIEDAKVGIFVKGAPERVLEMCHFPETGPTMNDCLNLAEHMAEQGYRVLAFAEGSGPQDLKTDDSPPSPQHLEFLGLVGMIDPLRPGVKEAVTSCQDAGIEVNMVTGDHPVTALAISEELGLAHSMKEVVTGPQIKNCDDYELSELIKISRVYSRVAPHEKYRIVQAAQNNHHFVAVTGDGVNDAPALKTGNIGVAMGKGGTQVARDASDIVISDDNFATIVAGVEEGRIAYNNVRNVIYLLISTGAAEVFMVGLAMGLGMPLPLLPAQLLWLNLVTNGIQDVALAFEPGLGDELSKPPRPTQEPIFNRLMLERILVGALVMGGVTFATFYHMLNLGWSEIAARNAILLLMVLFEIFHLGNSRSETRSAFALSPLRSPFLLIGSTLAFSIHVLFMYIPWGHRLLQTQALDWNQWINLLALASLIIIFMELHKLTWYLRYGRKRKVS